MIYRNNRHVLINSQPHDYSRSATASLLCNQAISWQVHPHAAAQTHLAAINSPMIEPRGDSGFAQATMKCFLTTEATDCKLSHGDPSQTRLTPVARAKSHLRGGKARGGTWTWQERAGLRRVMWRKGRSLLVSSCFPTSHRTRGPHDILSYKNQTALCKSSLTPCSLLFPSGFSHVRWL